MYRHRVDMASVVSLVCLPLVALHAISPHDALTMDPTKMVA